MKTSTLGDPLFRLYFVFLLLLKLHFIVLANSFNLCKVVRKCDCTKILPSLVCNIPLLLFQGSAITLGTGAGVNYSATVILFCNNTIISPMFFSLLYYSSPQHDSAGLNK